MDKKELKERVKLTTDEAIAMLEDGKYIHTFRGGTGMLIGADWDRENIIDAIKEFGAELSGEMATNMKHGIVLEDSTGYLFVATRT